MKKLLSDKDTSFDMTKAREEKSDSKNGMFLLYSALYYVGEKR